MTVRGTRQTNYAVAPGEYLAEMIADGVLTRRSLARLDTIRDGLAEALLAGTESIGHIEAVKLAEVTGVPAKHWLAIQRLYLADLLRLAGRPPSRG